MNSHRTNGAARHRPGHAQPLVSVEHLSVGFRAGRNWRDVVRSVSFDIHPGEVLGLVGESGSGKTVSASTLMGLTRTLGGRITGGRIHFDGEDVTNAKERRWRALRGNRIGMIFQQPTRSLDPAFTVGDQIAEGIRVNLGVHRKEAWARAVEMLDLVQIPEPARRARDYPHTFSGGMCQRAMIAMALASNPDLLIADEPTTALDVTVQAKILDLLRELQAERGIAVLYITHDLGVVSELCDRVAVMYAGEVVETATTADLFTRPTHPYTEGLLASIPRPGQGKRMVTIPGQVPAPHDLPVGCAFSPRCAHVVDGPCTTDRIELVAIGDRRAARCILGSKVSLAEETA